MCPEHRPPDTRPDRSHIFDSGPLNNFAVAGGDEWAHTGSFLNTSTAGIPYSSSTSPNANTYRRVVAGTSVVQCVKIHGSLSIPVKLLVLLKIDVHIAGGVQCARTVETRYRSRRTEILHRNRLLGGALARESAIGRCRSSLPSSSLSSHHGSRHE